MHLLQIPQSVLTIVSVCVALCPIICGLMAYHISHTYATRNANQA